MINHPIYLPVLPVSLRILLIHRNYHFAGIVFDDVIFGLLFTMALLFFSKQLVSIFLHEGTLIDQSALFLRIMGLSAGMLGVINTVTAFYQALGKASNSLLITMLRNIILFIPCVILLNAIAGLNGAIAAQPIVETILAGICFIMYHSDQKKDQSETVCVSY